MTARILLAAAAFAATLAMLVRDHFLPKTSKHRGKPTAVLVVAAFFVLGMSIWTSIDDSRGKTRNGTLLAQANAKLDMQDSLAHKLQDSLQAARMEAGTRDLRTEVRDMKSANDQVQLKLQVLQLTASLEPFIKFANANYPELSQDVALRRLAADFENLKAQNARLSVAVNEIERRDDYRPLVPALRDSVGRCLRASGEAVPGNQGDIPICTNGNKQNIALAREIDSLLSTARVAPRCQLGAIWGGSPFEYTGRVILAGPAEIMPDLESLRRPLSIIFRDSIILLRLQDSDNAGLWFMDTPQFDSLGRVRFI
jgi:hypothetical protein